MLLSMSSTVESEHSEIKLLFSCALLQLHLLSDPFVDLLSS